MVEGVVDYGSLKSMREEFKRVGLGTLRIRQMGPVRKGRM